MHNYAGNPASYPANVGLVDDSDLNPATASTLDVAPTNLADRTAFLHARSLDKTGDTITGHVHIGTGAELEVDSGGEIVVDAGANEFVAGNLEVLSGGNFRIDVGATGIVAGTLAAASTNAIQATNANTIVSTVVGGIGFGGGTTDFGSLVTPRTKAYFGGPITPVDPNFVISGAANWAMNGGILQGKATGIPILLALPSLQHGSTLTSVDVQFLVHTGHSAVPANLPSIEVYRLDLNTGGTAPVSQALNSTATQTFGTPPEPHTFPASPSLWEASSTLQTLTYVCNQSNVIDLTRYIYFVQLTDENGSGAVVGNLYYSIKPHYGNIVDLRFPS